MFYFQFRLTMRFPWRMHFEGSKMSILLRLSTNILTGFFLVLQHLFPGTRGCERGQGPGYFGMICEEPGPISLTQHWVASPEIVNYWESFSKASKDFWGGLVFLCGRGVARLFAGASCLWIVWEGGERGQQTGTLVSLLSGEIYGPFYQNQQETQFMGKKNQYSQGLL